MISQAGTGDERGHLHQVVWKSKETVLKKTTWNPVGWLLGAITVPRRWPKE